MNFYHNAGPWIEDGETHIAGMGFNGRSTLWPSLDHLDRDLGQAQRSGHCQFLAARRCSRGP